MNFKAIFGLILSFAVLSGGCASAWPPMPGSYKGNGNGQAAPLRLDLNLGQVTKVYSTNGTYTTGTVTGTAANGTPPYTYLWTRQSGSAVPTVTAATSATTAWSAAVVSPTNYTPVWKLTVTDAVLATATATAQVSFTFANPLTVSIAPTTSTTNYAANGVLTSAAVTANPTNGTAPYTYAWSYVSGSGVPVAVTPTAKSTTFSGTVTAPNNYSTVWQVVVTDALSATASATIPVAFNSTTLPLTVALSSGGTASTTYTSTGTQTTNALTATPSGGLAPFTYLWSYVTGSSVPTATASTSATTSFSTAAVAPNTYNANWNLTVTDANTSTASAPATVTTTYTGGSTPSDPVATLRYGIVADDVVQTLNWYASANNSPYTRSTNANYTSADFQNMKNAGITYIRIPIDVQSVLPGLPLGKSYLVNINQTNVYGPMSTNSTKTLSTTPPLNAVAGTGCGDLYTSNACFNEFQFQYLDQIVSQAHAAGLAVDFAIFASSSATGAATGDAPDVCNPSPCPNLAGGLQANLFANPGLYGYATFEAVIQAANIALVNRYATQYPLDTDIFWEEYNEPDYKVPSNGGSNFQLWSIWTNKTNGGAMKTIADAIRAREDALGVAHHWIIADGISAGKAQWLAATTNPGGAYDGLVPLADTKVIYSIHKYDDSNFIYQGNGASKNALWIYPAIGSGGSAIGRPGGLAPTTIPTPGPTYGTPSYNTTVSTAATPCYTGGPTPVYLAGTTLTGTGQMQACVKPGGSGNAALWDYYDNNGSEIFTKDWLLNDTTSIGRTPTQGTGIIEAINWAKAGGHDLSLGAPSVLKIIYGEVGAQCFAIDYRSCVQFYIDAKSIFDNNGVPGGQTYIPVDWWAMQGGTFGLKPKGGVGTTYKDVNNVSINNFCLATSGVLTGYNIDIWNAIRTSNNDYFDRTSTLHTGSQVLQCSGNQYGTPGLP